MALDCRLQSVLSRVQRQNDGIQDFHVAVIGAVASGKTATCAHVACADVLPPSSPYADTPGLAIRTVLWPPPPKIPRYRLWLRDAGSAALARSQGLRDSVLGGCSAELRVFSLGDASSLAAATAATSLPVVLVATRSDTPRAQWHFTERELEGIPGVILLSNTAASHGDDHKGCDQWPCHPVSRIMDALVAACLRKV
eukprot:m51a1_g11969 hypothetical protein (197) ;mRNA; f:826132-826722